MQQAQPTRRTALFAAAIALTLSSGAGAIALVYLPVHSDRLTESISLNIAGLNTTGFTLRSVDGSLFTASGSTTYDPGSPLQAGEKVQEGFVLLDGTLSVDVAALKEDGARAPYRGIFRMDVRRNLFSPESLAGALIRQGVVRGLDPERMRTLALKRARSMSLDDARVMRLVPRSDGRAQWIRAVRALSSPDRVRYRPLTEPDGVLGHFGSALSNAGSPYVWAVMDRSSRYAVGVTVDRDGDGVPNASDNCVGTRNSNQSNADGDSAGDACDIDDDNDEVLDGADNCPLASNADQADFDSDGTGNACDFDDDNDGVTDGSDQCLATAIGARVDVSGCSIVDHCPCESTWRNHGAYVRCVARTSEAFVASGLITESDKDAIVSAGAQASCGVK